MIKKKIVIKFNGATPEDLLNSNARDNAAEPFIFLKTEIEKLGYVFEFASNQKIDTCFRIIFFNVPILVSNEKMMLHDVKHWVKKTIKSNVDSESKWIKNALKQKNTNIALILWEGNVAFPENFIKSNYTNFSKILTWDDELVDGKRFHKFNLPSPLNYPQIAKTEFRKKKLLVNISFNKNSNVSGELYSERLNSIKYFDTKKPHEFDLYGFGWSDRGKQTTQFISYKGIVNNKWEILPNYKFAICYENNANQLGYITEKIFDCLRSDCIPIYWGAANISEYVDSDCFIDRQKFKSNKELDEYISNISESEYQKYRNAASRYLKSEKFKQFLSPAFTQSVIKLLDL